MSVNDSYWTMDYYFTQITKKTNSDHQIQQSHWSEKKSSSQRTTKFS